MKKRWRAAAIALATTLLAACSQKPVDTPAAADKKIVAPGPTASDQQLQIELAVLKARDDYDATLRSALEQSEAAITPDCPNIGDHLEMKVMGKLVSETDQFYQFYTVRYVLDVCGEAKIRNVMIGIGRDKEFSALTFAPGNTLASPILVQDALLPFHTATVFMMLADDVECEPVGQFVDTEYLEMQTTPRLHWVERWTMRFCDRLYTRKIDFFETDTGTSFAIEAVTTP